MGKWKCSSTHSWSRHWMEMSGQFHVPRERAPGTHYIGRWVGPRARLNAVMKRKFPASTRNRTLDLPSRSAALYHWAVPSSLVYVARMLIRYTNPMPGAVHWLRYTLYTRRFGCWLCCRLQLIGFHFTDEHFFVWVSKHSNVTERNVKLTSSMMLLLLQ
jgi:hypothetical protein